MAPQIQKRTVCDYALWAALPMAQTSRIEGRLTMILDSTRSRHNLTRRTLLLTLTPVAATLVMLAMLRPDANAQATLHAVHQPMVLIALASPPTPWNVKAGSFSVSHDGALTFSPDLSINGAPLLTGVTDRNLPGNRWWTAAGADLPNPIYKPGSLDSTNRMSDRTMRSMIFAFRLPPTAKDVTTKWELPQSQHYSSDGTWLTKMVGHDDLPEAKISGDHGGVRTVSALYPRSLSHAAIRIGIASGPWTTAATQNVRNDWFGTTKTSRVGTFIFSRITQVDGGRPAVTISTDQRKQDIRVVAVDTQGHDILPSGAGDQSTDKLAQMTVEFALPSPATQLTQIRVETRPFQWIQIRDVALQPVK